MKGIDDLNQTSLMPLRLAFMGTPDFAVPALKALVAAGHYVVCVYTQPPRPSGRGYKTQSSSVQLCAEAMGLTVRHPVSLKAYEAQEDFTAMELDAAIVAAYGLILPPPILEAPKLGCINIHGSLLPRWRGAAPIHRAILAGDTETGITIMQMEAGLDTGPMLLRESVPITATTTASTLYESLAILGAKLIVPTIEQLAAGTLHATPQPDEGVTYAAKLDRLEGQLDWRCPADYLDRQVRALHPTPGVWFGYQDERIKVLAASYETQSSTRGAGTVLDGSMTIACGTGVFRAENTSAARPASNGCLIVSSRHPYFAGNAPALPRYKLTIEYDGTGLVGWQRQPAGDSVQTLLEAAFQRMTGHPARVLGAGRTDAGVHALGQVAHVDLQRTYRPSELCGAINFHIRPAAISLLRAEEVEPEFNARFSATGRGYLFRILNRRSPAAIDQNRVWHVAPPLDVDAMAEGAHHLVGHHDFTTFRAAFCQATTPVRTLDRLEVTRQGEELHIVAEARSFLYHQVRNMVGTLKLVGLGQWPPERVRTALLARDRAAGGPTAPPTGLYLTFVSYAPPSLSSKAACESVDAFAEDKVE